MSTKEIPAPEGALRQVLRQLETARDYITKSLEGAKEAYRGYPDRWAAEERDLADADAAIAAARAALAAQPDLDLRDDVIATQRGQLAELQALCDERWHKLYGAEDQAPAEAPGTQGLMSEAGAFRAYLADCDNFATVPDVAGAFHFAWAQATIASKVQPKGTTVGVALSKSGEAFEYDASDEVPATPVAWRWEHYAPSGEVFNSGISENRVEPTRHAYIHEASGEWVGTKVTPLYAAPVPSPAPAPVAPLTWYDGPPPFPQDQEWFIAETTYGDRVCLVSLDEGRGHKGNYAFKTADGTYIKEELVKRWMQFPDCEYLPPAAQASAVAPTCNFRCGSPEACAEFGCAGKAMADNKELP